MPYRYLLTRTLTRDLFDRSAVSIVGLFIGLNPSTADDHHDDPTVRRWRGFARSWGWSEFRVVNLYAWRATRPSELWRAADPIGPDNDRTIIEQITSVNGPTVCCWGAHADALRADAVLELLALHGTTPYALGVTSEGQPSHVLYLPKHIKPRPWVEFRRTEMRT